MTTIFQQILNVLLPNIALCFTTKRISANLQNIAAHLPPIMQGGFEVRLGSEDSQVDIQQCIPYNPEKIAKLSKHIKQSQLNRYSQWEKVHKFADKWQNTLNDSVNEIWLEIDSDRKNTLPIVFLGIERQLPPSAVKQAIEQALECMDISLLQLGQIERCVQNCSGDIRLSHIGIMLSRDTKYIRVNIKGLNSNNVLEYLQRIGWRGNTKKLHELFTWAFSYVDKITVAIDIDQEILPNIGLECILLKQPDQEPRWSDWLKSLMKKGFCTKEQHHGLLAWPGVTTPVDCAVMWPDYLIAKSLFHYTSLTAFIRRLSHIKLTCSAQGEVASKAYLWFEHEWRDNNKDSKK